MTTVRRGRRIAATVGFTALLLVICFVLTWDDLVVRYRLYVLRNDPAALKEGLGASEDSLDFAAVRQFVRTPVGGQALFHLLIDEISRVLHGSSEWHKADFLTALFWIGDEKLSHTMRDVSGGSGGGTGLSQSKSQRLRVIWKLTPELSGQRFTTEDFPNMAFRFYSGNEILTLADYDDPGPSPWLTNTAWHWRRFPADAEPLLTPDRFFCLVTPHGPNAVDSFLRVLQKPRPTMDDCNGVADQRFLAARTLGELGAPAEKVLSALARVVREEEAHLNEAEEFVRADPHPEHLRISEFHRKVGQAAREALESLERVK